MFLPGAEQPNTGSYANLGNSGFVPPDAMGTVSRDYMVIAINGVYVVYKRRTGAPLQVLHLDDFWANAGLTPYQFSFDPRILWDEATDRWFVLSVDGFDVSGPTTNHFLLAVSTTNSPLATPGNWHGFTMPGDSTNTYFADFPMLGYNDEKLVIASNLFGIINQNDATSKVVVLDKLELVAGFLKVLFSDDDAYAAIGLTPHPAVDLDGSFSSVFLVSQADDINNDYIISKVDFSTSPPTLEVVAAPSSPCALPLDIPQSDPNLMGIEGSDTRVSTHPIIQGGQLYFTRACENAATATNGINLVQWDLLAGLSKYNALITYSDAYLAFPSVAIASGTHVCIGANYASPSANIPMSGVIICSLTSNLNDNQFGDAFLVKGSGFYDINTGNGYSRWGDYTATMVDPLNPAKICTFIE